MFWMACSSSSLSGVGFVHLCCSPRCSLFLGPFPALPSSLLSLLCRPARIGHPTKARVAWKVVLYFSNRASICSHALNILSPTRWFVMTGWRIRISLQPFVQTRGSFTVYKHQSPPCVSNMFGLGLLVCVHASVSSLVFQTRLDHGSVSVYEHQSLVLCFEHVCSNTFWIMVPCLCTRTIQQPFVSNTFDCG